MRLALINYKDKPAMIIYAHNRFYKSDAELSEKYSKIIYDMEQYRIERYEDFKDKIQLANIISKLFAESLKEANIKIRGKFPVLDIRRYG